MERIPLPAPNPKTCPGGVTLAEIWMSESPWKVVTSPVAVEPGVPLGLARALPGPLEARRARVFVSLVLSAASPTPSAVPSLTLNILVSPRLCFPWVTASGTPGSRPGPRGSRS